MVLALIFLSLFCVVTQLDKGDSTGFYTFGFIDDTVLPTSSPITYANIDASNGFWEFPSPELKVDDTVVTRASGNTAIADTGTTVRISLFFEPTDGFSSFMWIKRALLSLSFWMMLQFNQFMVLSRGLPLTTTPVDGRGISIHLHGHTVKKMSSSLG
jgi:Eukaryotic aspartyl protease